VRVVSLVPSVTETLAAWGVDPVACTRFCERPDLTQVGGTKNPDVEAIVALGPDVVVLDRHENRREDADALTAAGIRIVVLDVRAVDGLADELDALADGLGIERRVLELPRPARLDGRVFVPIWRRPWMTLGPETYGSSLLARLGLANVFADSALDYPVVTLDDAADRGPDVVLVPSEPYEFSDAHLVELEHVAPTVRVDGQDLFWWGARTPAALVRLRARLTGVPMLRRPG
jgi:ABC-type Fe3+-hydroxamate transport system substrate-binding protein